VSVIDIGLSWITTDGVGCSGTFTTRGFEPGGARDSDLGRMGEVLRSDCVDAEANRGERWPIISGVVLAVAPIELFREDIVEPSLGA